MFLIQVEECKEKKIEDKKKTYNQVDLSLQNVSPIIINPSENKNDIPSNIVQEKYKGYPVIAKLEIPKIELETFILEEHSEETLRVSVTKFWGANPNDKGNFCIAGHNFKNKNMFHNLRKLEIGDRFFIEDNKNRESRI